MKVEKTCSIEGCSRPVLAKGLCNRHYLQKWRGHKITLNEDLTMPSIQPYKVALEIAEGKRCSCGLLKPCGMCVFESAIQQGSYADE